MEEAYGAFLAGAARYRELLQEARRAAEERGGEEPFLAWLGGQEARLGQLEGLMEDAVLDAFLRVWDRNIRLRHWEEGVFL